MNVSIIGSGYVGLVTGACLADRGHRVTSVDVDRAKVDAINAGRCPIHEAGLPEIIARHAGKNLTATTDLAAAVKATEVTLIAAPTPFDGRIIDLSFIRQIAIRLGEALREKHEYHVFVVKSTVVPGTTDDVVGPLIEQASGKRRGEHFGLGMNPEFLSEGVAVADFMHPDRIVVGGIDDRTRDALAALYASFAGTPVLRTNNATAEMIKYASNALQATMISFANEIANIAERVDDVDAMDVMRGVHAMKELTWHGLAASDEGRSAVVKAPITSFLSPGCGFGGSCFPKDVKAITAHGKILGAATPLLDAVLSVNANRPALLVDRVEQEIGSPKNKRIAVLGLAFKPGTDDMRESPAIPVIRHLQDRGARVVAFDPVATEEAKKYLREDPPTFAESIETAIRGADAVVLVTRWPEFAGLPEQMRGMKLNIPLIDGRRMIAPDAVSRYAGVGLKGRKS